MKALNLIISSLLTLTALAAQAQISSPYQHTLSGKSNHFCAIESKGVTCWGRKKEGQLKVPSLKNPKIVTTGLGHTCALDDNGVACWGLSAQGQTKVPALKNPRMLSSTDFGNCAIDDNGLQCWGGLDAPPSDFKNLRMIYSGAGDTCALHDEGVKCWGANPDVRNVPALKNPHFVSVGEEDACAIDSEGVKCWGVNYKRGFKIPILKNPRHVSVGDNYVCALDDKGVTCWGRNLTRQVKAPVLKNPKTIATGRNAICALDDSGVKCWGFNQAQELNVPNLVFGPQFDILRFSLDELSTYLKNLAGGSTPARTALFTDLQNFAEKNLNGTRGSSPLAQLQTQTANLVLAGLLAPAITNGDSAYYTEKVIPAYEQGLSKAYHEFGVSGISEVNTNSPLTNLAALKVMQASISVANGFLSVAERNTTSDITKLIGVASASAGNRQAVLDAVNAVQNNKSLFEKLKQSPKSDFLVNTLFTATEWLDKNIR